MNLWFPLSIDNCLLNGCRAELHPDLWKKLDWRTAEHAQIGRGTALRLRQIGGTTPHHLSPDALELALAPGEVARPVRLPDRADWQALYRHGWVWLVSDGAAVMEAGTLVESGVGR
jgi:hypothetical protein